MMELDLKVVVEYQTGSPVRQCRSVPVCLGPETPRAFLLAYSSVFDDDPYVEMFFFPDDTLHLSLISETGLVLWNKDLGKGVLPGVWFCPVLAFDLDGDGVDEIWYVNNTDPTHPLGISNYCLERLDPLTGLTTGRWSWPNHGGRHQSLSHMFRNYIIGGYAHGEPVLVTAQGTYNDMYLQGWRQDMSSRWVHEITRESQGARGSHTVPIVDINHDGVDEVLWGERCIELDAGRELFCCDRDAYRGHSDIIQPVLERGTGRWFIYTCRESDPDATPRVVLFDDSGGRIWGSVDHGHIDMGMVSRWDDSGASLATAVRVGGKSCGPDGRFHDALEEFAFDALSGSMKSLPFSSYKMIPVDIDGDGLHEFVQGAPGGDGMIVDRCGNRLGTIHGAVALAGKILDMPGEQLLSYHTDGAIRIWVNGNAKDTPASLERYANSYYRACLSLQGNGYNWGLLGGL